MSVNFSSAWRAGFTDAQWSQFNAAIAQSGLLSDLLNTFNGTAETIPIVLGVPGGGTFANSTGITVDPTWLPNSTSGHALSPDLLADVLAHELGHAVLPNGIVNWTSATNPTAAVQVSLTNEGTAVLAEYIVAQQLGLKTASGLLPDESSDLSGTLTAELNSIAAENGANVAAITTVADLTAPGLQSFVNAATLAGYAYYATQRPSTSPTPQPALPNSTQTTDDFSYTTQANLVWTLFNFDQYLSSNINFASGSITNGSISVSGNLTAGWTFAANNIPLVAGSIGPNG